LLFLLQEGKTNKVGRKEFMGSIRHENPLLCSHGALAEYLFWRFHVSGEESPSFHSRRAWYDLKLLVTTATSAKATARRTGAKRPQKTKPGGAPWAWNETELSYIAQAEEIWRVFTAAGITSVEKTHAMRGCGARAAELHGVPDPQVSLFPVDSPYTHLIDRARRLVEFEVDGPVLFDRTSTRVPPVDGWIWEEAW
jgi:hypothetical protein